MSDVSNPCPSDRPRPIELAGMPIHPLRGSELLDAVFAALTAGRGGWIITANLDHLQRYQQDPAVRALYRDADWVVADGAPVLWAARVQGTPLPERVAGSDLSLALAERACAEDRSIYLLGGAGDSALRARRALEGRWPGIRIVGTSSPRVSLRPSESELAPIREHLEQTHPDLVYVALGAPKQEHLIEALHREFPATWFIGVGISLSFIAGDVERAPLWLQRVGLEWLHRMAQEPSRLVERYLKRNLPFLVVLLLRLGLRRLRRS